MLAWRRWTGVVLVLLAITGAGRAQYGDISDLPIAKPEDKEDVKSEPPPEGALVLFDGKSLDNWTKRDSKNSPGWKLLEEGIAEAHGGDIMTKQEFDGNFKLHVEFRVPYKPKAKGQARGNSGVYVQGRYEVQVLDSYGLESKADDPVMRGTLPLATMFLNRDAVLMVEAVET